MKLNKYIEISRSLIDLPKSEKLHFSFIVRKNRILSIGFNNKNKSNPLTLKLGYRWYNTHSELSAVVRFKGFPDELRGCSLINVRLNKDGKVMYSRPCIDCLKLIANFGFKQVFFTGKNGEFDAL